MSDTVVALLSSIQPVASKAARSPLPVTSYDNFLKTVRELHAGWGGLVASFAEGMGHLCCVPFAWWKTYRFRTP